MTTSVKKWRVYCEAEGTYRIWWLDAAAPAPTTCPVDTGHALTHALTNDVTEHNVSQRVLIEEEESLHTQGFFRCLGRTFDIDANVGSVTLDVLSWPYDVTVLGGWFVSDTDHKGDCIHAVVAPNTVVGILDGDVSVSSDTITVSQTVVDHVAKGFQLVLSDGANESDMGEVVSISGNVLQMEQASAHAFSAATPTAVQQTITLVDNLTITAANARYEFAQKKQRGKGLPANVPLVIQYVNAGGGAKTFSYNVEYIY